MSSLDTYRRFEYRRDFISMVIETVKRQGRATVVISDHDRFDEPQRHFIAEFAAATRDADARARVGASRYAGASWSLPLRCWAIRRARSVVRQVVCDRSGEAE